MGAVLDIEYAPKGSAPKGSDKMVGKTFRGQVTGYKKTADGLGIEIKWLHWLDAPESHAKQVIDKTQCLTFEMWKDYKAKKI